MAMAGQKGLLGSGGQQSYVNNGTMGVVTPRAPTRQLNPFEQMAQRRRDQDAANSSTSNWWYAPELQGPNRDADEYHASLLQRYLLGEGGLEGDVRAYAGDLDPNLARSAITKLRARAAERRGLRDSLSQLPGMEENEARQIGAETNQALNAGLKATKENYNRRGLLYSGMRQGAEQSVRGQAAATMAGQLSQNKRNYANLADARRQQIASVDLNNQQEALDRANAVMENNMRSSIARQQAYQQLGQGLGYAAAVGYGHFSQPSDPISPTPFNNSQWNSDRRGMTLGGME